MTRKSRGFEPPSVREINGWRPAAAFALYYGVVMPICAPFALREYIGKVPQRLRDYKRLNTPENRRAAEERNLFRQQRITDKPPGLPAVRPRTLSLNSGNQQQTSGQTDSFLLAKLPIELRTKIWELVLGGHTIGIFRGHGRLLHRLQEHEVEDLESALIKPDLYANFSRDNLSSLLKTCRQVYTETVEILYSKNKFSLWQNDTISWFHSTTLPSRLSTITSLTLHWQFCFRDAFDLNPSGKIKSSAPAPWDAATWKEACKILEQMASLKELNVVVRGPFSWCQGRPLPEENHSGLLGMLLPLCEVRVVEKEAFRVRVPWPQRHISSAREELRVLSERHEFPFTMVHPEEEEADEEDELELIDY